MAYNAAYDNAYAHAEYPTNGYAQNPYDEPQHAHTPSGYATYSDKEDAPSPTGYNSARTSGYGMITARPYRGNSIWTVEDKSRWAERNGCGKLLGSVFCFVILAIIGVVSGILLAVMFARPPNVGVSGYSDPKIGLTGSQVYLNTTVYAGVANPNSVTATVKHINATIYEANVNDHAVGAAKESNIKIASNANTTIALPASIQLVSAGEALANAAVFQDVAKGCGWQVSGLSSLGSLQGSLGSRGVQDHLLSKRANTIPLLVDLNIKVSVLSIGFTIPVKNIHVNVDCPDLSSLLSGSTTASIGSGSAAASAASSALKNPNGASSYLAQNTAAASSLLANDPSAASAVAAGNNGALSSLAAGLGARAQATPA